MNIIQDLIGIIIVLTGFCVILIMPILLEPKKETKKEVVFDPYE